MHRVIQNSLFCLFVTLHVTNAYKPVIFMHGILSDPYEADTLFQWIKQDHPGTVTFTIDMYNKLDSLVNMMEQVDQVGKVMMKFMQQHPDGVNLICFSQGGLVCRGVLEQFSHNVDTFISLSSPQSGQFGDTDYVKYVFPNLLRDNVYKIAYSKEGQNISVGNYWNDPHHQDLYKEHSEFLAVLNNDTFNQNSKEYKANFLRLRRLVMIGGKDDGVITPWQSSHFAFYDEKLNIVEIKDQKWYTNDMFGLQSLDKRGGLFIREIPGVQHTHWHSTYSVYKDHILPFLS
ncbi:lysosomal thioesterase PPT2-A-like [Mercenaria mercenaria]|uniref:lysosomal thioesterase PPT2-A-like n=1 Tax=Mercenaria mercenaria TaxID=6596 RepID=UPI00234F097B|nr:lysosomal thioesterase PPT2-A-like [Mercenaria mercenaria]